MNRKNLAHSQSGLTIIELMIASLIGLIVSGAAMSLFSDSINAYRVQLSAADIQDTAVFGLNYTTGEVSLANLGAPTTAANKDSPYTGVVLTTSFADTANPSTQRGNLAGVKSVAATLVTSAQSGPSNVKSTGGSALKSDQLVIQYRAPYKTRDCEGNEVTGAHYDSSLGRMVDGDMVIERFYVAVDPRKRTGAPDALSLVLMCDAGSYPPADTSGNIAANSIDVDDYGDSGVTIMKNIDQFEVRLGVDLTELKSPDNPKPKREIGYMSIADYSKSHSGEPILAVQLGVIAKAKDTVKSDAVPSDQTFELFGRTLGISDTSASYIRRAYTNTVMLRNARATKNEGAI